MDGREVVETATNPEVLDDWALHQNDAVHSLKLTVGACWQGTLSFEVCLSISFLCKMALMDPVGRMRHSVTVT